MCNDKLAEAACQGSRVVVFEMLSAVKFMLQGKPRSVKKVVSGEFPEEPPSVTCTNPAMNSSKAAGFASKYVQAFGGSNLVDLRMEVAPHSVPMLDTRIST